ncbi:MAG: SpoIIE family protein phosphatase [Bacteroidales bacterium]|nr:SpoIIE family protein phosphatase [Bacteroidales bacterium]
MNLWKKISILGVSDEMPIYKQKSTIFFNIVMRISIIVMISIALLMIFVLKLKYVPIGIFAGLPLVALSLFLNLKGKVNLSIFITSLIFPIYFTFLSVFSKLNGEGLTIIYSMVPRFGIIIMSVISFAVLGFGDTKKAFSGAIFGLLILIFFNKIHALFGINIKNFEYNKEDINILIIELTAIFVFIIMIVSILQKINNEYEQIVTKQKEELEEKNIEIIAQKDEIETQRDNERFQKEKIEVQNKEITDSIKYASRIQNAALPSLDLISNLFELFVFFKPRDIVSGDFYWFKKTESKTIVVAADCTGHGVPGAFVSLLGISFLNEIITKKNNLNSDEIVNLLRDKIKHSMRQDEANSEQKDGMDLALFIIDEKTLNLQFTGAQNPLYIVRKNMNSSELDKFEQNKKIRIFKDNKHPEYTLIELKADRMPVGIYLIEKDFSRTYFQLKKEDIIYSFSDGYIDQFGGEKNEKFLSANFKKLLVCIAEKPIHAQKIILDRKFKDWKGNFEQLDDVLVIGLKI